MTTAEPTDLGGDDEGGSPADALNSAEREATG
jgi:hypothetical protein